MSTRQTEKTILAVCTAVCAGVAFAAAEWTVTVDPAAEVGPIKK